MASSITESLENLIITEGHQCLPLQPRAHPIGNLNVDRPTCIQCNTSTTPVWQKTETGELICWACAYYAKFCKDRNVVRPRSVTELNRTKSNRSHPEYQRWPEHPYQLPAPPGPAHKRQYEPEVSQSMQYLPVDQRPPVKPVIPRAKRKFSIGGSDSENKFNDLSSKKQRRSNLLAQAHQKRVGRSSNPRWCNGCQRCHKEVSRTIKGKHTNFKSAHIIKTQTVRAMSAFVREWGAYSCTKASPEYMHILAIVPGIQNSHGIPIPPWGFCWSEAGSEEYGTWWLLAPKEVLLGF